MAPSGPAILILDHGGIGPRVADARKLRGLTQQGLALLVPCSKSLVSQVERGCRPATPWFVAAVARALHLGVTELTGQPYRGATERADRIHAAIPELRVALTYADVPPEPGVAPRRLGELRRDVTTVAGLLDRMDYLELGRRLPGLVEELSSVWHGSDGPARREAAELLLSSYLAVKAVAYRLGYVDLVSVAIGHAARLAAEVGNPELLALVAEERCQVFFATGAHDAGTRFVRRAHRQFDSLIAGTESGLAIIGSLQLRAAVLTARSGTGRSEAWDHLGHAREISERIGRETNHHGLVFGPANVRIHEVATAVELDDHDEAIRLAGDFEPPPGLPPERASHHYLDLARARLAAGQRGRALDCLLRAERLAPQHARNHPMARETTVALLRAQTRVPESLRSMARRMKLTPTGP